MIRVALLVACVAGCGGTNPLSPTGAACRTGSSCAGGVCLASFPGGACTSDCADAPCPGGAVCRFVDGAQACLTACARDADCGAGRMCERGACRPGCAGDGDCAIGEGCSGGTCHAQAGKPLGASCAGDGDCAQRTCDPRVHTCARPCLADGDCASGETCWVDPIASDGTHSDGVKPLCVPLRAASGQPGDACGSDGDCRAGSCQLGVCTSLCQVNADCPPSQDCVALVAEVEAATPLVRSCLVRTGTITVELGQNPRGGIGVPSSAIGWTVFVAAEDQSTSLFAGVSQLVDPDGTLVYTLPSTLDEFYAQAERYDPAEGTSTMLVPNAPAVVRKAGFWSIGTFASTPSGSARPFDARVRFKLAERAPSTGTIPLHVFVTDLSSGCAELDRSARAGVEWRLRAIYAAAGLTIDPILWSPSSAPSTIVLSDSGAQLAADALLAEATAGDTPDVLELVIVQHIDAPSTNGLDVLGRAGGIPGAIGVPGTPHSGAIVSLAALCAGGPDLVGTVAAHELAHTMGLFHNVEADGHTSALGDDASDGDANLMFWSEGDSTAARLSPNQRAVLLANPSVAAVSP